MENQDNTWKARLPQDLYVNELETIQDVNFTRREVDIVSCLLSGKTAKQIAAFLSISPKTVENHVRNISLKTDCRTQAAIIDFIEKSEQFSLVKNHYTTLLIQHTFAIELKKISKKLPKKSYCCIIYNKTLKSIIPFFSYFIQDLQLAGIDISIENIQENDSNFHLPNNIRKTEFHAIFYYAKPEQTENPELNKVIQFLAQYSCRLIFISIANNTALTTPQKLPHIEMMVLTKLENYYFFVFEVLKKLFPSVELEENISIFKQKYKIFSEPHLLPVQQSEVKPKILKKTKNLTPVFGIIGLIMLIVALSNQSSDLFENIKEMNPKKTVKEIKKQFSKEHAAMEWNVPRQDNVFVGRKKLLEELYTQLNPSHKTNSSKTNFKENIAENETTIIGICAGLGGIGKTQLALRYMNQFKDFHTLRAWFYAENVTQLKEQYIEFARSLGYNEDNLSFAAAFSYIKKSLSQHPGWLFIYDNVTNYQEIKDFLPEEGGGYIIMTTRQQHWPSSFKILNIDIMTENDALDLLQSLIKKNINHEKSYATTLVKTLGFLPLAVAQAGAYIQQNNISIAEYLILYQKHEQELLSDPTIPLGVDSLPVAVTWDISLQAINQDPSIIDNVSLPIELLMVCAYLAPEKISRSLLLNWLEIAHPKIKSPLLKLNASLAKLRQYSMIHDDSNEQITVHRLVQTIMRYKHDNVENCSSFGFSTQNVVWYDKLLTAIHTEFSSKTPPAMNITKQRDLLPHMTTTLQYYEKLWPHHKSAPLGLVSHDIGITMYYSLYDPKSALPYLKSALKVINDHFPPNHIQVANILNDLGNVYGSLDDHEQKRQLVEQALTIKEPLRNNKDVNYISTLNDLANTYFHLNNYNAVLHLLEQFLGKHKQDEATPYSLEHAKIFNTLSITYAYLGKYEESLKLAQKVFKIKQQHYPHDHEEYAKTLNNLAMAYGDMGDYVKKFELIQEALVIYEKVYNTKHPEYVKTLGNLAIVQGNLGNYDQKRKILEEQVLNFYKKHYGITHMMYAGFSCQLASAYGFLGDYKMQHKLLIKSLPILKTYFGSEHVRCYVTPLINLALAYGSLGDYKQQFEIAKNALTIIEKHYGTKHIEYFIALHTMANAFGSLGNHIKNIELLEEVLSNYNKFYGPQHDAVGSCLRDLASAHLMLKQHKEAQLLLEQALKIKERIYGQQHVEYAHTLHVLGDFYIKTQNYTEAQTILSQALQIKKAFYGDQHVEYAKSLYALAENYMGLKNYSGSKTLLKQVLKINERFYGKQHPRTQQVLVKLAEIKISKH